MFFNFLKLSFHNLLHRKARSILTMLGIIIAVSVVIALLLLGQGLSQAVTNQLKQFGSDLIFVFPGDIGNPLTALFGGGKFRDRHLTAAENVEGVDFVMPTIESVLVVGEFAGEKQTVSLHAQPWREIKKIYEESQGFRVESGVWPTKEQAREIVLGNQAAKKLFKRPMQIGDELVLKGRRFQVAGILKKLGEQNHDNSVFISLAMIEQITGERGNFNAMIAKVARGYESADVVARLEKAIAREKGLDDFSVLPAEKAGAIAQDVIRIVQLALLAIAMISMAVGGVVVMNTMFTAVLERRRDIGILKAVGASSQQIVFLFLVESGLVGLFGGLIGIAIGSLLAKAAGWYARGAGFTALVISLDATTVLVILAATLMVGILAGVAPAYRASRLRPAEALKYR